MAVDGPYGHFDFDKGHEQQLWIAGGMGITPFLAYLHTKPNKKIDLYYSFHGQDNAIYKDFLQDYAQANDHFTVTLIDTTQQDRLSVDALSIPAQTSIFICGPKKMIKHFKSTAPKKNVQWEAFSFKS